MLVVALLFSCAAVIGKKGIIHSSPLFFSFLFFLVFNSVALGILRLTGSLKWRQLFGKQRRRGMWLGVLLNLHVSCHGLAIAIATAIYMVTVKRSSLLFCALCSWLILRERQMLTKGPGTLCMFLGLVFISLLG